MSSSPAARRIKDAYLELLAQYPHGPITVTQIAQKAQVNRVTFYRLFGTQEDVLLEILDEFDEGTRIELPEPNSEGRVGEIARAPLEHHRENAGMLRTVLLSSMAPVLEKRIEQGIREPTAGYFSENRMLGEFYVAGTARVICSWIKNGCRESVDELLEVFSAARVQLR